MRKMKLLKYILFSAALLISFGFLKAQNLSPRVMGSAGGFGSTSEGTTLSWTVGEIVIKTDSISGGPIFTQGFHQPKQRLEQTITFGAIGIKTYNDVFTLMATSSSGLPVTFTIVANPSKVDFDLATNKITIKSGTGTVTVRATQEGDEKYYPAEPVERVILLQKADQAITFAAIPNKVTTDPPFNLTASSNSTLPVSFQVTEGASIATVDASGKVTLSGLAGTVTIRATQAGDANYKPAPPVDRSFVVNNAALSNQQIVFNPESPLIYSSGLTKTLEATSQNSANNTNTGLPVTFTLVSGPATLSGATLTITGPGTVVVKASQGGSSTYNPAADVIRSIIVNCNTVPAPSVSNVLRCGPGSVTFNSVSGGVAYNFYDARTGGNLLADSVTSYTLPSQTKIVKVLTKQR
jgi:hypothetical protein